MVLILAMYALLASTFTLGKAVLAYINPILFIGIRMTLGGLLLLGYVRYYKSMPIRIHKQHVSLFAGIVLFHIYCAYIFEFVALQHMSSSKACLLYNLSPFLTAACAYFFFAERMSHKKWFGLLLGCLGFLPTLLTPTVAEGPEWLLFSQAELLLLLSVFSSVIGWMVMKRLTVKEHYSPVLVNGIGMFAGGLCALATSLFVEGIPVVPAGPQAAHSIMMVALYTGLLILIANVIFYNLYGHLLKIYSTTFLSFAGFTCPIFAAAYGYLFLGEMVPAGFFVSLFMVFIGLFIFYQEELR